MTPLEFHTARKSLGLTWGPIRDPQGFPSEAALKNWQVRWLAWAFNMNEKTIRVWERPNGRGPHPTAAVALRWMMDGLCEPQGQSQDMDGAAFAAERQAMGLSVDQMADLLGITSDVLTVWEDGRGPHPAALRVLDWLKAGFRPGDGWPTVREAASRR